MGTAIPIIPFIFILCFYRWGLAWQHHKEVGDDDSLVSTQRGSRASLRALIASRTIIISGHALNGAFSSMFSSPGRLPLSSPLISLLSLFFSPEVSQKAGMDRSAITPR